MNDMRISHPMLAATAESEADLRYPLLATPKIDGIRCLKLDGRVLTRSFKPVRNRSVVELVSKLPDGVDGELVAEGDFQLTQSAVMSYDKRIEFKYCVFDLVGDGAYKDRAADVGRLCVPKFVELTVPTLIESADDLLRYEEVCLRDGYEGVMTRDPDGPYKCGRSTLREGWLVKLKRYKDSEAVVLGVTEQMENCNEPTRNELGYLQRLGGQGNMMPKGTLGSCEVQDVHSGVQFNVGTGWSDAQRAALWALPPIGRVMKYRYQEVGVKAKPRFPRFLAWVEESL